MNRKICLALSFGLLATLLMVDVAMAKWRLSVFVGTRAQVTNACSGNMELSQSVDGEGMGWSFCLNYDTGNAVRCSDAGICTGAWNDGVPDVTSGGREDGPTPRGRPLIATTPSSLSEPGNSSSSQAYDYEIPLDPPTDEPIDPPTDVPIIIN